MEIDKRLEIKLIDWYMPITELMDKAKVEYSENSNFLCPFHDNYNTPSAHLYLDSSDGGGKIWCYSEQKMYGSYNFIKLYFPNIDTRKLAIRFNSKVWRSRSRKTTWSS